MLSVHGVKRSATVLIAFKMLFNRITWLILDSAYCGDWWYAGILAISAVMWSISVTGFKAICALNSKVSSDTSLCIASNRPWITPRSIEGCKIFVRSRRDPIGVTVWSNAPNRVSLLCRSDVLDTSSKFLAVTISVAVFDNLTVFAAFQ